MFSLGFTILEEFLFPIQRKNSNCGEHTIKNLRFRQQNGNFLDFEFSVPHKTYLFEIRGQFRTI